MARVPAARIPVARVPVAYQLHLMTGIVNRKRANKSPTVRSADNLSTHKSSIHRPDRTSVRLSLLLILPLRHQGAIWSNLRPIFHCLLNHVQKCAKYRTWPSLWGMTDGRTDRRTNEPFHVSYDTAFAALMKLVG